MPTNQYDTMGELKQQVGQLLKNARKQQGWTQQELGQHMGIATSTIKRYELGQQNLTLDTIEKIARSLGVNVAMIIN